MAKKGQRKSSKSGSSAIVGFIFLLFVVGILQFFIKNWQIILLVVLVPSALILIGVLISQLIKPKPQRYASIQVIMAMIDNMSGEQFEDYCIQIFRDSGRFDGCRIYKTAKTGDFGVDIIIQDRDGTKTVFQCKRYAKNLGVKPIQEVFAGKRYYGAAFAGVITNTYYTQNAISLAKANNVLLYSRTDLENLICACREREIQRLSLERKTRKRMKRMETYSQPSQTDQK